MGGGGNQNVKACGRRQWMENVGVVHEAAAQLTTQRETLERTTDTHKQAQCAR